MTKEKTIAPKETKTIVCKNSPSKQTHNECDVGVTIIGVFESINETTQQRNNVTSISYKVWNC